MGLGFIQRQTSPSVYLDHWALLDFSADRRLGGRLVAAIKRTEGSLALSWANISEFMGVGDDRQRLAGEDLVEALLPNIFFVEAVPTTVMVRENVAAAGDPPTAHLDPEVLRVFTSLPGPRVRPFTAQGLFPAVADHVSLTGLQTTISNGIDMIRHRAATDPKFRANLKRPLSRLDGVTRATRYLAGELITGLALGGKDVVPNDAMDVHHAIVPSAYCDLVLLDKHWKSQVQSCARRLKAAGIKVPIAKVFSKGKGGLEKFFAELEKWPSPSLRREGSPS